jgi:hypothetical protein
MEAPEGKAYIGDDRGNDVKYAMSDFNDNMIRINYYLSLMFDPVQATLFERRRDIGDGGGLSGKLTWISKNSKNKLYETEKTIHVTSFDGDPTTHTYHREQSEGEIDESLSKRHTFRDDSILGRTQAILDSMPKDGKSARTHVGNVIDQTSRIFKEGDEMLSRGSAIKYIDKYNEESGMEYCRVWTKDRAYFNYSDTMKRTENIRKFDDSIMGGQSRPWNINIAPMSDGNKGFAGSTNIFSKTAGGSDFYAKKYMFSIENLAWKTSDTPGFTYNDLPYCERGNNGGRVMWFPPYDLKISENNSARWNDNTFLGRPEPVFTYQDTSRTAQLSFKVVVDHPSVLNLLVREHFRDMSDEETENYINAFFAGCEEVDFYSLIRKYTFLDTDDLLLIKSYLESGKDPQIIQQYKTNVPDVVTPAPSNSTNSDEEKVPEVSYFLKFENDIPGPNLKTTTSEKKYSDLYEGYILDTIKTEYKNKLSNSLINLGTLVSGDTQVRNEKQWVFNNPDIVIDGTAISGQTAQLEKYFDNATISYNGYADNITQLKTQLSLKTAKEVTIKIESSCSSSQTEDYNEKLSLRRSHSVIKDIFDRISSGSTPDISWISDLTQVNKNTEENNKTIVQKGQPIVIKREYPVKSFGYDYDGKIIIESVNYGEKYSGTSFPEYSTICTGKEFKKTGEAETSGSRNLGKYSPIAFYCRQTKFDLSYVKKPEDKPSAQPPPVTTVEPDGLIILNSPSRKPMIDPMKRIIMKTLGECYYFKKLEEDSPLVFKSLRDKLKYFHPGFHSTTPEGLNSRLTFMLQCIRPGDTIPIKGISDASDLNARNTSFGPPPVCVLRIGDFYHSKIIIRDVNISYDEGVWDLNPEGIGIQPMIANVTCQITFIGGQGLSKPVERLQNALSSNFFANTEMYDERSISTSNIDGKKTEEYTKQFLESLNQKQTAQIIKDTNKSVNKVAEGKYIGTLINGNELKYVANIDKVFELTKKYFQSYETTYNSIYLNFGTDITTMVMSPTYREINGYDVYTTTIPTPGKTISLFGLNKKTNELSVMVRDLKSALIGYIDSTSSTYLCEMLKFDKEMTGSKLIDANTILKSFFTTMIGTELDKLVDSNLLSDLEGVRNELITWLDGLNFVIKNGKDSYCIDEGEKVMVATFSGFTSDLLYNEYKTCIDYFDLNNSKLISDLTSTINFIRPVIQEPAFISIISVLLSNNIAIDGLTVNQDKTIYPDSLVKNLNKRINNFINKPSEKEFRFSNFKERKSNKDINFTIASSDITTDTAIIEESKKINSSSNVVINKLNYYRKG